MEKQEGNVGLTDEIKADNKNKVNIVSVLNCFWQIIDNLISSYSQQIKIKKYHVVHSIYIYKLVIEHAVANCNNVTYT